MSRVTNSTNKTLVLDPKDNVAVALRDLVPGEKVAIGEREIALLSAVPLGHKLALEGIAKGEWIVKYGERIGKAKLPIRAGEHVHVHNVQDATEELVNERRRER